MFTNISDLSFNFIMHYHLLVTIIAAFLILGVNASSPPSATVEAGVIIGTTTSIPSSATTVNKFLGIPFAAPPIRFSPPQKPRSWSKPLSTKTFKSACIQQFSCKALNLHCLNNFIGPRVNKMQIQKYRATTSRAYLTTHPPKKVKTAYT
jgi:hypothetical protein